MSQTPVSKASTLAIRVAIRAATHADEPLIGTLMRLSIRENMKSILTEAQIDAATETMGLDATLIADGTYYLMFVEDICVACGGWGRRRTLYGSSDAPTHDDAPLDPSRDAARIRAMYTHPDHTRRGFGARLLSFAEEQARQAGYTRIRLGSTEMGQPFYLRYGYVPLETISETAANGETKRVIVMEKPLAPLS